jgi:hypothetical protein
MVASTFELYCNLHIKERDPLQSKGTGEYPVCGRDYILKIKGH